MDTLARLRNAMAQHAVPALLVADNAAVAWLTGFTGTFGRVVVSPDQALFITDSRYTLQAEEEVKNMPTAWFGSPKNGDDFLAEQIKALGISEIAFDESATSYGQWQKWQNKIGAHLVPVDDLFAELRMVKSPEEIDKIRDACRLADAAFDHIVRMIQPGVTEMDIALDLEFFIRRQGAEVAFPSIVVSGERSARPHGKPSDKKLAWGDFVTMDFGARLDGYNSDITRTVVVGEASARQKEIYETVLEAQLESLHALRAGARAADVDRTAREVLALRGLDQYFGHGLGHGLGRLVHDSGRLATSSQDVIAPGQVWTIEPGVYIPGLGGVRIEDDAVVTEDGIEVLTRSTKELLELPRP